MRDVQWSARNGSSGSTTGEARTAEEMRAQPHDALEAMHHVAVPWPTPLESFDEAFVAEQVRVSEASGWLAHYRLLDVVAVRSGGD